MTKYDVTAIVTEEIPRYRQKKYDFIIEDDSMGGAMDKARKELYAKRLAYYEDNVFIVASHHKEPNLIAELRSVAFDLANSGKHGGYPLDDTFNDAVEEGFVNDGTEWVSKDRRTIAYIDFEEKTIKTKCYETD